MYCIITCILVTDKLLVTNMITSDCNYNDNRQTFLGNNISKLKFNITSVNKGLRIHEAFILRRIAIIACVSSRILYYEKFNFKGTFCSSFKLEFDI